MMEILGRRRITIMLSLFGVCFFLGAFYLALLLPQVSASDRTLRSIRGDVSGTEDLTRELKAAFEQFQVNKPDYDRIEQIGFFNPQDRLIIRDKFQQMKRQSGVLNAKYEFSPAEIEPNPEIQDAGYRVLKSEILITIDALDDMSVYAFLYALTNEFPGRVSIADLNIIREDSGLNAGIYQQIRSGKMPLLIIATVRAEWRSLVSAEEIKGLINDVVPQETFE